MNTPNSEITVEITALGNRVGGISAGPNRKTVFVRGALPGETVRCRTNRIRKNIVEADLMEILEESPNRTRPFCGYFGECGGCSLQNLAYSRQLFWKRNWATKALARAGIEYADELMKDVIPSPATEGYRNRVSFDIVNGKPGLHRPGGDTMNVDGCPLLNRRGQKAFGRLLEEQLDGIGRVSVRASDRTGESMLEFSHSPAQGISSRCDTDIFAWKENDRWKVDPPGSAFHEISGGFTYTARPGMFFQVNTECADIIISIVTGLCRGNRKILDLYGGCGTFSLPLASNGAEVTSVELNPDSSISGREAAELSGTKGISFLTSRTRHFLLDTVRAKQKWDTVIVDPPRAGLGIRVARLLRRVASERIVYVSCNPFSLARDLKVICEGNWAVAGLQPVDMFPQTDHVETVVTLMRKEDR
ncbi:MAG: class I SAM-dependent RNA methyltransferase [Candidatus Aegiribacteria sp.]|nr:class I SAM-dependent RNA methyltransferase [Candidatus Aegiribacteria sp.]